MKMSKEETVTEAKHVFHVHLHPDDTRLGKMVDDKTVEPIGAKPKGTKIKLTVPAHDTRTARDKATRYATKNFGVHSVKSIEYKGLHEEMMTEAKKFVYGKPYKSDVASHSKLDTEHLKDMHNRWTESHKRDMAMPKRAQGHDQGISDRLLAVHHILKSRGENVGELPKHPNLGMHHYSEETKLDEAIKGWKNAASDIRKQRSAASDAKKSAVLVSLKKDGSESGMYDAKSYHASEEEARKKHDTITKLNPNRKIRHNLYVDGKKVDTLGEETNTEKREEIENVARMDGDKPTSKKSTLIKTGQIKTKIVEEKPTMSVPNFGLPKSLIDAVRQIVEKKDEDEKDPKKMTGGKTAVDIDPETDDKQNDDDAAAKGKKKAVKEETKSGTEPKTEKEKNLAALASPKDKITHKDVLVGRGVVKEEEVEFSAEEIERIEAIAAQLDEAKPTIVSAPIRGANQDQSGVGTKSSTADYTISDSKKMKVKGEVEELDELEKSTLGSYVKKAKDSLVKNRQGYSDALNKPGYTSDDRRYFSKKSSNRARGIDKAVDKLTEEEVDLEEAIKIGSRVKVHAPGKDYHGVIGNVGEIDHGLHKKSEKKYTVDYNNRSNSVTLPKSQIKLHTEEVDLDEARGRPRKNPLPAGQEADVDDTHKHPMQQLEKIAHSIEGREPHFEHKDGSETKVGRHLARHMVMTHNSMKTTQEKDDFANKLHANRDSMRTAMSKHF
jgi:hypothetical protein